MLKPRFMDELMAFLGDLIAQFLRKYRRKPLNQGDHESCNSGFRIKPPIALCPIATKRVPGFSLTTFDTQIAFIGTKHNKTTKCYVKDGKFQPLVMPNMINHDHVQ